MKIVVHVGLGIVRICPAIKQKGVLSILPKIQFFSNLIGFNMKTDNFLTISHRHLRVPYSESACKTASDRMSPHL